MSAHSDSVTALPLAQRMRAAPHPACARPAARRLAPQRAPTA